MILRTVASPAKGLDSDPTALIGGGGSPQFRSAEKAFCRRFDRVASHERVGPGRHKWAGNRTSLVLNERDPALKVFWPRINSGWAQEQWLIGLLEVSRGCRRKMTKKNRAGGSRAGDVRSAPFGSKFRYKH